MEILEVEPDLPMQQMTALILEGTLSLQQGYGKLKKHPLEAEPHAQHAHKTERKIEKIYRRAVSHLLDDKQLIESMQSSGDQAIAMAITGVVENAASATLYRIFPTPPTELKTPRNRFIYRRQNRLKPTPKYTSLHVQ